MTTAERAKRKNHPDKAKIAAYIPVELDKAMQHANYGDLSNYITRAIVIMLALKDAPAIGEEALRVYEQPVPIAVAATKRAIVKYIEEARMKEYFATLPAAEKARILAGMKK